MNTKYFINKAGCETRRMAGEAGQGHIDSAATSGEALDPMGDVYRQMFQLGYIRVMETETELHVDAPHKLTSKQRKTLLMLADRGPRNPDKEIIENDPQFQDSRSTQGDPDKEPKTR